MMRAFEKAREVISELGRSQKDIADLKAANARGIEKMQKSEAVTRDTVEWVKKLRNTCQTVLRKMFAKG